MGLTAKDLFLVVIGFALSIAATGIWQWWAGRSDASRKAAAEFRESWRRRLASADPAAAARAYRELFVRAFIWFILGNVMFALSGISVVSDIVGRWEISSVLSSGVTLLALVFFAFALRWLRLYLALAQRGED